MKTRNLRDIEVSEIGMGCMAFSHGYGQNPEESYSISTIRKAYDYGCTFFDTAEVYSPNLSGIGHNERIVGKALHDVRKNIVLDACIHTVKPGGAVVMIGNSMTETIPVNINRAVLQEVNLLGSVSCTREEFTGTIDLIANGIINPERYVTDIVSLEELQSTFERLISKTDPILKAVVKP